MAATIEQLQELVVRGSRECPHLKGRLEKAAMLVVLRGVVQLAPNRHKVGSEDGLRWYEVVNGTCECYDYQRHGEGHYCKHRLAVGLWQRLNGNGKAKVAAAPQGDPADDLYPPARK